MSRHTPGAWEIAPRIAKYSVIPANDHERGQLERIGALTFDALSIGTPKGQAAIIPLDESSRDNATLIAAAPEMFDLLNQLNNWLVCAAIATPDDMAQSFESFQKSIDDLINKARGEV